MELPSATDREGREIARDYQRRKSVQLALDVAKEYRMATAKRDPQPTLQEWMVEVSLPPHHLWVVKEEPTIRARMMAECDHFQRNVKGTCVYCGHIEGTETTDDD